MFDILYLWNNGVKYHVRAMIGAQECWHCIGMRVTLQFIHSFEIQLKDAVTILKKDSKKTFCPLIVRVIATTYLVLATEFFQPSSNKTPFWVSSLRTELQKSSYSWFKRLPDNVFLVGEEYSGLSIRSKFTKYSDSTVTRIEFFRKNYREIHGNQRIPKFPGIFTVFTVIFTEKFYPCTKGMLHPKKK